MRRSTVSTSWCRSSLAAAAALALACAAAAQLYEHPRYRWRIDFPAGWSVKADAPRGASAWAPKGRAALVVAKARAKEADADAWDRSSGAARLRPYEKCRESLRAPVVLRGRPGLRVEFDCRDRATRVPIRGWRTVLVADGVADEVSFEAAPADFARWRPAAEAALRSFLPSFDASGLGARR